MSEALRSVLLGTLPLSLAFALALGLGFWRRPHLAKESDRARCVRWCAGVIALQALHATEEFATGFYEQYPQWLGLQAWSPIFFSSFNGAWIGIWLASAFGFSKGWRWAVVPIWFLGIGATVNGPAHGLMALSTGSYFPGLLTAVPTMAAGALLLRRLWRLRPATTGIVDPT